MIYHSTPGAIPLQALTTLGISAKETDNPIGMFGTGFKYAVAIVLRNGGRITVTQPDGTRHEFGTQVTEVRGNSFQLVTLDGQPLGFTTALGKNWNMNGAFRELHSNTLDESGRTSVAPVEGWANISVSHPDYENAFASMNRIFLSTQEFFKGEAISLHYGSSPIVFYRGIAVYQYEEPLPYTVNLTRNTRLTEDRTLASPSYDFEYRMDNFLREEAEEEVLMKFLLQTSGRLFAREIYESQKNWSVAMKLLERGTSLPDSWRGPLLKARRAANNRGTASTSQQETLKQAIAQLAKKRIYIKQEEIIVSAEIGSDTLGLADLTSATIYLHPRVFDMGYNQVLMTLVEEWAHLETNEDDDGRNFLNLLLEKIIA